MYFKPHEYQQFSIEKIINNPALALFLEMGLGKTVCTLTAINELMYNYFAITKVLVVAPKKVAESTWDDEISKWEHLKHLKVSKILGSASERSKALLAKADIYIINRENIVWLTEHLEEWPFDMLVLDESSSFKNHQTKRFKALRKFRPLCDRVICLTGTPTSNSLMDLWAQMYLLDKGERLGRTITIYRSRWFLPDQASGHIIYSYKPKPIAEKEIYKSIADISFSMKAEDWLKMPKRIDNIIKLELTAEQRKLYKELEKEYVLSFPAGDVTASTAAVLSNKLLQLANGALYTEDKKTVCIHDAKLEALEEIAECGKPLLVFYTYKHDRERILAKFKQAKTLETDADVKKWNAGKIQMLVVHPASVGYGLNLQAGGHIIVWYGLTWSLEQYQQANARLYRQGQTESVIIHHLVCKGTVDERVIQALENKELGQAKLIEAVKAKIKNQRV